LNTRVIWNLKITEDKKRLKLFENREFREKK